MPHTLINPEEALEAIRNAQPHFVETSTRKLQLIGDEKNAEIYTNGVGYKLPAGKHGEFQKIMGVDIAMMAKLPQDLRAQCWNYFSEQQPERKVSFKVDRVNTIQQFTPATYEPLNYDQWTDRIFSAMDAVGVANLYEYSDTVGFGMVTKKYQEPKPRGGHDRMQDPIHEGIYFWMNGRVTARSYNLRMVCTNGALGVRYTSGELVLTHDNFDNVISRLLTDAAALTHEMLSLADRPLQNTGGLVGRLSQLRILSARQTKRIVEQISQLGDQATEYDLVNLITAQQHSVQNDLSWLEVGGEAIRHLHRAHCSHCGALN